MLCSRFRPGAGRHASDEVAYWGKTLSTAAPEDVATWRDGGSTDVSSSKRRTSSDGSRALPATSVVFPDDGSQSEMPAGEAMASRPSGSATRSRARDTPAVRIGKYRNDYPSNEASPYEGSRDSESLANQTVPSFATATALIETGSPSRGGLKTGGFAPVDGSYGSPKLKAYASWPGRACQADRSLVQRILPAVHLPATHKSPSGARAMPRQSPIRWSSFDSSPVQAAWKQTRGWR